MVKNAQGIGTSKPIPPVYDSDSNILTNDFDKAEAMNDYFASIGTQLAEKFDHDAMTAQPFETIYRITPTINNIGRSENQVRLKLSRIKQKTGGPDKITSREMAEAGDTLFEGLFSICKNSIQRGLHPSNWKIGEVIPVFKKGSKSDCANYRPLTMLNLNSKLLESIVCDSLDKHLEMHSLFHSNQWGFKRGISTESLLVYLTETWKKAIDTDHKVGVLFIDFKKAFDTVDHNILQHKLSGAGISGCFHEWIVSYLSNRCQFATVNGVRSGLRPVNIGVPQGSLLGPRLFAIYANDLPNSSATGFIHMFADDTTVYYIGKEVEEIVDALNRILIDFKSWCDQNRLTVHTGKTEVMLICKNAFVGPMRPLIFGNSYIYFTSKSTCLGVVIDHNLNWKPQIKMLHSKFGGKLKFLKSMKGLPTCVLEEIYYKGIVPSITYCIAVWGSCSLSLFNDLEHLHIKAAKLIHKLPSGTPDCDALKRARWKPLSYIYKRRLASIMYQVHNDILPIQLTALLGTRSNETSYKLRRSHDFSLVRYHSELGRYSIRYRGPIVWNSIPKFIRNVTSLQLFKEKLKLASKTLDQIQFEKEACHIKSKDSAFLYF